jgi:hypothetical protein
LIKGTDSTYEWQIFDSARNSSGNPRNLKLEPNTSDAEASTGNSVNFYDDGFDFNSNSDKLNGSSKNYIYAAFADRPGNNWTPTNLSADDGVTTVDQASGGTPIQVTTDTFGKTLGSGINADPNASSLTLCMPLTSQGSLSITDDVSPAGRTVAAKTVTNSGAGADTSNFQYYGGSSTFNQSQSDRMYLAGSSDFAFGTGDFTVELWYIGDGTGGLYNQIIGNITGAAGQWRLGSRFGNDVLWFTHTNPSYTDINTGINVNDSKWHHLAISRASNTFRIFVDGEQKHSSTVSTDFTSTTDLNLMYSAQANSYCNGNIQDVRIYKGAAKYTSAFTVPGRNESVAINNDSLVDSPTNGTQSDTGAGGEVVGNYATLNPLANGPNQTLSNGNLELATSSSGLRASVLGTIGVSSGKWFWEMTVGSNLRGAVGIASTIPDLTIGPGIQASTYVYNFSGELLSNNTSINGYGPTWSSGDVIGVAYDLDAGTLTFYRNGTSLGTAYSGLSGTFLPITGDASSGGTFDGSFNFGQRAFAYPLSGYKSLNTANLPTPTIADGSKYFDAKLWTGNGGTQAITGLNFSPDFAWLKLRNGSSAISHILYDAVRGAGSLKGMNSDKTRAEGSCYDDTSNHGYLDSFDANGFTVVDGNAATNYTNSSNLSYVGWAWDAGSSNTTIAAGGLNSSVYNQSQTWSNDLSAAINSTENQAFDGNLTNVAAAATTAGAITWTPTGGMSYTSSVRAYTNSDYVNYAGETSGYSFNGGSTIETASAGWYTLATGSGTITSISHSYTASYRGGITAIEVDGKILVDSGVTPATNVPTIASTVRANPSAGFSIVSYSGVDAPSTNTVAHGLNVAPSVYIIKNRTSQSPVGWVFNTTVFDGSVDYMFLNLTNAKADQGSPWNTLPTSSVFTLGANDGNTCNAGDDFITYCFAPVEGYSAMGSYTGNGSADGPFVALSFKPRWIITKRTDSADYWYIFDTARDVDNVVEAKLEANSNAAEYTSADWLDIVSNGFKIRASGGDINASGGTYLYMAFAENPFQANGGLAR